MRVIRGGLVYLVNLLFERFVLFERNRQRGTQRHPLRAEECEALPHTFHHAFKAVTLLSAGSARKRIRPLPWKRVAPREEQDRRCVVLSLDFDELVKLVGCLRYRCGAIAHAFVGAVEEQVKRERFGLAPDEL